MVGVNEEKGRNRPAFVGDGIVRCGIVPQRVASAGFT